MDYKDFESGCKYSNFWLKAKKDMTEILIYKAASLNKNKLKILDIGTGIADMEISKKYGKVHAIDIDKNTILLYRHDIKGMADACSLPYKNNSFDMVICMDVFEHIQNDMAASLEIHRVLKKGGFLLFSVPAFQFLFSSHDRYLDHKRRYQKFMIKDILSIFDNINISYWNFCLFIPIAAVRILKRNSQPRTDLMTPPKPVNFILHTLLKIENSFIRNGIKLPIGISIVGYCRK